jgi:three-Cys-motif partner protein
VSPTYSWDDGRGASLDQAFFEQRHLTSRLKHLVLEAYVAKFSYHMAQTLYYVDGFAGAGIYRGLAGGPVEPGSPVLIAQLSERLRRERPGFNLRCLNVEAVPARFRQLEVATAHFKPSIVEENFPGRFTEYIPDILERIRDHPTFFFMDPFGTKGISFQELRPIFNRRDKTEILITLHTAGIAKKAGHFRWMEDDDPRRRKTGAAMVANLAKALDVPLDVLWGWWALEPGALEERVVEHYLHHLRAPHTGFQFTKAFPVYYPRPDAPPGGGDPICFYLVFGTQSKTGLFVMNDCMVRALERFEDQEYSHTLYPLFRQSLAQSPRLAGLDGAILATFRDGPFTIDQVKERLMQDTLLLVTGAEYRKAVLRLKSAGHLQQLDRGPIVNDRTRFRVSA